MKKKGGWGFPMLTRMPGSPAAGTLNATFCPAECQSYTFPCGNGRCVKIEKKCDGTDHCGNGADEKDCTAAGGKGPKPTSTTSECSCHAVTASFSAIKATVLHSL